MAFNFERFTRVGGSFSPRISLRSQGVFGFSRGALHKFGLLEGVWHVVLFYDRHANVIGFKITNDPAEEGAIKLVVRRYKTKEGTEGLSSSVSAKSFFDFYNIPRDRTRSYLAEKDPESELIVVRLNDPVDDAGDEDLPNENSEQQA